MLAYVVRKLLLTHFGVINEVDRDSYSYKRVDLPGSLLVELYRELWGKFIKNTSVTIDKEHKFNFKKNLNKITNQILRNKNQIRKNKSSY